MKKTKIPGPLLELANKETDHCYRQQIDETEHQNHRMVWIFAAQTLLFAALPLKYVAEADAKALGPLLFCIIMMIGTGISISSIYSMLEGEFAIGNILDEWTEHNRKGKLHEKRHMAIVVPPAVLKSRLRFLSLYSCAPKILCTAWITICLVFINHYHIVEIGITTPLRTNIGFIVVFATISAVVYFYSSSKNSQIANDRQKSYNRKLEREIELSKAMIVRKDEQLGKCTALLTAVVSVLSIFAIYGLSRQLRGHGDTNVA